MTLLPGVGKCGRNRTESLRMDCCTTRVPIKHLATMSVLPARRSGMQIMACHGGPSLQFAVTKMPAPETPKPRVGHEAALVQWSPARRCRGR